jgi:ADP-heptose:LPS heptosyltransferase
VRAARLAPRALDLTGQTTTTELLHLFDLAQVLVTNDLGPAHFAALTRIHEVVFFGPEIPDRYRPLTTNSDVIHTGYSCSPCIGPLKPTSIALQRQLVPEEHQHRRDRRAGSLASRCGAVFRYRGRSPLIVIRRLLSFGHP